MLKLTLSNNYLSKIFENHLGCRIVEVRKKIFFTNKEKQLFIVNIFRTFAALFANECLLILKCLNIINLCTNFH